jgi:predicted hydrocarbon binding protein
MGMERRNITLEKKHLEIISPLLEKHEGNISACIREIIDFADLMVKNHGSLENAISDSLSNEKIENQRVLVDQLLWQWLLETSHGMLPAKEVVASLIGPVDKLDHISFAGKVNDLCIRLGWKTKVRFKSPISYVLSGGSENQRELISKILCIYLVNHCIGIELISNTYSLTTIDVAGRSSGNEAYEDCVNHLGFMDRSLKEVAQSPDFWNSLITAHLNTDYHMVTIHRKDYERLLSAGAEVDTDIFSVYTGLPCCDVNLQRLLPLIKSIFETSRIVDKIEVDRDILRIFHSYTAPEAIEHITGTILNILELNGYHFEAIHVSSIIILQHKTEIEGRITELVNNLLRAKGGFNHELLTFLMLLDGIKEKTEINSTVEILGMRMGEQILKEYGKQFNVNEWDMESFKEAFSNIDRKLGRESMLELIDPHVMHYVVRSCQIVHRQGKFNKHLCNLTHGLLKGAVNYVFKGDAAIRPKQTIGHGDGLCEFYIVLQKRLRMPADKSHEL